MTDGARARAEAQQRRLLARCREAGGAFAPIDLPRPEDLLAHLERRAEELGPRLALHKGRAGDLPATVLLRSATVEAMAEVVVSALIARRGPDALANVEPKR